MTDSEGWRLDALGAGTTVPHAMMMRTLLVAETSEGSSGMVARSIVSEVVAGDSGRHALERRARRA